MSRPQTCGACGRVHDLDKPCGTDCSAIIKQHEAELTQLRAAVRVLGEECRGWRKWESECSAMAALRPAESPELNETADNSWIKVTAGLVNMTNLHPIARAAVEGE